MIDKQQLMASINPDQLLQWKQNAIHAAREASANAYAPYSHFPVGAALLMKDGTIIKGCNIENASYGLCSCGERTAMFSAITQGYKPEEMLGIVTYAATDEIATPCGACRQVMSELIGPEGFVICTGNCPEIREYQVKDLLPDAFAL